MKAKFLILLLVLSTKILRSTDGTLDTNFGNGLVNPGFTLEQINGQFTEFAAVVVDTDGTIIVAGFNITNIGLPNETFNWQVARFSADGKNIIVFDDPGITTNNLPNAEAFALAIQADGKIVVTGAIFNNPTTEAQLATVRYNSDGKLDKNNFGSNGSVITSIGNVSAASSIALQEDGKIVIAGETGPDVNNLNFVLGRYTTNGTLDSSSFNDSGAGSGVPGIVVTSFSATSFADAVAIQDDGQIIAAGLSGAGAANAFAIARYDGSGTLLAQFTDQLNNYTDFNGGAIALQSDGKIIVAGSANTGTSQNPNNQFVVARYLPNPINSNSKDTTTFNAPNGYKATNFMDKNVTYNGTGGALIIQSDGSIVIGGDDNGNFALARFTNSGNLDPSFTDGASGDGQVVTNISGFGSVISALALQQNGKIIAAGIAESHLQGFGALARYDNSPEVFTPTLDPVTNPSVLSGTAQNLSFITVFVDGNIGCQTETPVNADPTMTDTEWSCTLNSPLTPGHHVIDVVSLYKPANINLASSSTVNIPGVKLAKSAPSKILAGSFLDYTITVSNAGLPQTDVVVTDTLPSEVTFVSASGAPFTVSGQTVTFTIPSLGTNASVTLKIRVKVANLAKSMTIINTVTSPNTMPVSTPTEVIALTCNVSN